MQKKAKFLYRFKGVLWYEYRGRTYIVNPELWTSTADQHRTEQAKIDADIEREKKAEENQKDCKPVDLDEIWNILGWD